MAEMEHLPTDDENNKDDKKSLSQGEEQENSENREAEPEPDRNIPVVNDEDIGGRENYFSLKNIEPHISPITAAFIGLIGGFLLYQILGGLLTFAVFGMEIEKAPVNGVRLMTMGGQILFILLPALIFTKMFYEDVTTIIRFKLPHYKEVLLFTLGIIVLTPLLQHYLAIQSYYIELLSESSPFVDSLRTLFDRVNEMVEETFGTMLAVDSFWEGTLVIIVIAVTPAICEEVMFRGFIQRSFEFKLKPFNAALITAVFFGLYHFNPYGLIPLIILGLYFGYAAYLSDSIAVPMVLHFFNNFSAVMLYFIIGEDEIINTSSGKNIDVSSSFIALIVLLVIFSAIIYMIQNYYKQKNI